MTKEKYNPLNHIMGVEKAAKKWGYSPGYIKNLCAKGIVMAEKIGSTWVLNKDQPNPKERLKMDLTQLNKEDLLKEIKTDCDRAVRKLSAYKENDKYKYEDVLNQAKRASLSMNKSDLVKLADQINSLAFYLP